MPLFQRAPSLQQSPSDLSVFKFKTRPYRIQDAQGSKTSLVQDAPQQRPATAVSAGAQLMNVPSEFKIKKSKTFSQIGTLKKRFSFKAKNMRSLSLNDADTQPRSEPERPKSAPVSTSTSSQKELPHLLSSKHLHAIINEELIKSNKLPLPDLESVASDLRHSSAPSTPTTQSITSRVFAQCDDHRARLNSIDDRIEGQLKPVYSQLSQVYTQLFDRVNDAIAAKEKELAAQLEKENKNDKQRPVSTTSSFYPDEIKELNISQFSSMSVESAIPKPIKAKPTLIDKAESILSKAASFISKLEFFKVSKDDDQYDSEIKADFHINNSQELVQHLESLKEVKLKLINAIADQATTSKSLYDDKHNMLNIIAPIAKEHKLINEANTHIATLERTQQEHFV